MRVVLDSGALWALADKDRVALAVVAELLKDDVTFHVPSVVLAECLRGGRYDPLYRRVLDAIGTTSPAIVPVVGKHGEAAGTLLGRTKMDATIDAIIVAVAAELGAQERRPVVITADSDDMPPLGRNAGRPVSIVDLKDYSDPKTIGRLREISKR